MDPHGQARPPSRVRYLFLMCRSFCAIKPLRDQCSDPPPVWTRSAPRLCASPTHRSSPQWSALKRGDRARNRGEHSWPLAKLILRVWKAKRLCAGIAARPRKSKKSGAAPPPGHMIASFTRRAAILHRSPIPRLSGIRVQLKTVRLVWPLAPIGKQIPGGIPAQLPSAAHPRAEAPN